MRRYIYVGPKEILDGVSDASGSMIRSMMQLRQWLFDNRDEVQADGSIIATFVIDSRGHLRLDSRHSEHVACAGREPVLSAGEITFSENADVIAVSNQSTGYCPEPESWASVARSLDQIGVKHPDRFTTALQFRLCPQCGERNIVKDDWHFCELCEAELPRHWNFPKSAT